MGATKNDFTAYRQRTQDDDQLNYLHSNYQL